MQTTANLWELLCREFQSEQGSRDRQEASRKFLAGARQVFSPRSLRLCDALEIVGDIYQAEGLRADAVASFLEALEKCEPLRATGSQARICAKLTLLLEKMERWSDARAYGDRALNYYESAHDLSQHTMLLNHLGRICRRQGKSSDAAGYYHRALDVSRSVHGPVHPSVAAAMNNLAVVLMEARDFAESENYHLQALGIREKCFGSLHPDMAQSLANLAVVYHSTKSYAKARSYYQAALKVYRSIRPPEDPEILALVRNIAALPEED